MTWNRTLISHKICCSCNDLLPTTLWPHSTAIKNTDCHELSTNSLTYHKSKAAHTDKKLYKKLEITCLIYIFFTAKKCAFPILTQGHECQHHTIYIEPCSRIPVRICMFDMHMKWWIRHFSDCTLY